MKKNKGFTLPEMIAVIAILMLLALISTPYVKGYIDDAYNGKALIYMRELNEARLNFEREYPGITIDSAGNTVNQCDIESIHNQMDNEGHAIFKLDTTVLIACNYLRKPTDVLGRYTFQVGSKASCSACEKQEVKPVVSMLGGNTAGIYKDKCACMDSLGRVYKQEEEED